MKRKAFFSRTIDFEWIIGYRRKGQNPLLNAKKPEFTLINNTVRYWCADPFLVEDGDKTYLFFEAYHRFKRKGAIGYREIGEEKIGRIKIIINEPFHLSYPYIYKEDDAWYIIPESKDANQIIRYKSTAFPVRWEQEKVLVNEISAVDSTLHPDHDGGMRLLTYTIGASGKAAELQLLHLKDGVCDITWRIEDTERRKRPAGKLFEVDDIFYRPSQLCTRTYGEALIMNRIWDLGEGSYQEEEVKVIHADDIKTNQTIRLSGIHTYNSSENWEVIDVLMTGFSLLRILTFIPRAYHFMIKKYIISKDNTG
jgi:hypothetical protein